MTIGAEESQDTAVTMKDVARRAGVSTATVSAVLNDSKGQASAKTAARVKAAMEELGYVPNPMGRNLRTQRSRMWTLTVPSIENPFITQVVRGVEDVAVESGYSLMLGNTQDEPEREQNYLRIAGAGLSDGVIIAPTTEHVDVSPLLRRRVPVVSIVRPIDIEEGVDTVLMDNVGTADRATQFLIDRGCRRIAYVGAGADMFADRKRVQGYRACLARAGLPQDPSLVVFPPTASRYALDAAQVLKDMPRPDALLVANSLLTVGVVESIRSRALWGGVAPELVTFDDPPWARPLLPFVHVMQQPAYELGRRAGLLLLERIGAPDRPARHEQLSATLRPAEREYTG